MTDTATATATATIVPVNPDTEYLDEQITVCAHRGYFDLKEIEDIIARLESLGQDVYEISGPIVDWTRDRIYCSSDKFQNALLDIRNMVSPHSEATTEEFPK